MAATAFLNLSKYATSFPSFPKCWHICDCSNTTLHGFCCRASISPYATANKPQSIDPCCRNVFNTFRVRARDSKQNRWAIVSMQRGLGRSCKLQYSLFRHFQRLRFVPNLSPNVSTNFGDDGTNTKGFSASTFGLWLHTANFAKVSSWSIVNLMTLNVLKSKLVKRKRSWPF